MDPQEWIGRTRVAIDTVTASMVTGLRVTLDLGDRSQVPLGLHWLCAQPQVPAADLGPDGHPRRGLLLPDAEGSRMWAGSALEWFAPLSVGDVVHRTSTIGTVAEKEGRSGRLTFVEVLHEDRVGTSLAIRERQSIVYRTGTAPGAPPGHTGSTASAAGDHAVATDGWPTQRIVTPDPVMLFRYSALTFNGHRIHYDHPYATAVEGYRGLVVHGPLIATLLLDLLRRVAPGPVRTFEFRGVSPAIADAPLVLEAREDEVHSSALRARTPDGALIMTARATHSPR